MYGLIDRSYLNIDKNSRNHINDIDENGLLKQELIVDLSSSVNLSQTEDNKLLIELTIGIRHRSKIVKFRLEQTYYYHM